MRILHITPDYPSAYYIGGQGVFTREIARKQVMQGHRVSVLAPIASQYYGWNRLKRSENDDGIRIVRLETNADRRMEEGMALFPPTLLKGKLRRAKRLIRKADIVHIHNFWLTGFLFPLLKEILATGKKCVFSPFLEDFLNPPHSGNSHFWYTMLSMTCNASEAAIAWSYDELIKLSEFIQNIYVFSGGIRPEDFPGGKSEKRERGAEKTILTIGNICERKNTAALIEAMQHVKYPFRLYIVGATVIEEYFELCRAKAAELGITDRVIFTGSLPKEEILKLYSKADVFVLPSLAEAFGLTIIEAMASSLPVIISRASLSAEHITDSRDGLLFNPHETGEIAEKLNLLFGDPAMAERIGRNAREKVLDTFTWDRTARLCTEVYDKALKNRGLASFQEQLQRKHLTENVVMGENERGVGIGWFHREKDADYRWMWDRAYLLLNKEPGMNILEIEADSVLIDGAQTLDVIADEIEASPIRLQRGWRTYRVPLPRTDGGIVRIKLRLNCVVPREERGGEERPLGLKIRRIGFSGAPSSC